MGASGKRLFQVLQHQVLPNAFSLNQLQGSPDIIGIAHDG